MNEHGHPHDVADWRVAIERGVGLTPSSGEERLRCGTFPHDAVADWVRREFADMPPFVEAVTRNIRRLADWVYGDAGEPFWPGTDADGPAG